MESIYKNLLAQFLCELVHKKWFMPLFKVAHGKSAYICSGYVWGVLDHTATERDRENVKGLAKILRDAADLLDEALKNQ